MALFDRLARRTSEKARELADEALKRAEGLFAQLPDVRIRREGDTLIIEGEGLMRRWLSDARLRFALWRRG